MQNSVSLAKSRFMALLVCVLAVGMSLALQQPAQAHKRNFARTYEWFTPVPGEKEIEVWMTSEDKGKNWEPWLEYEFAITPRYAMGLYWTFKDDFPRQLQSTGWKWENRYRFGEFAPKRWLHAAYLEMKKQEAEPYELEAKWLLSRYTHKDEALAFNLIAEKELTSGEQVKWEYAAGWSRPVRENLRLGVEAFGEPKEKEHFLGPTLTYDINPTLRLVFSAGAGLTRQSDDLALRAVMEYERF